MPTPKLFVAAISCILQDSLGTVCWKRKIVDWLQMTQCFSPSGCCIYFASLKVRAAYSLGVLWPLLAQGLGLYVRTHQRPPRVQWTEQNPGSPWSAGNSLIFSVVLTWTLEVPVSSSRLFSTLFAHRSLVSSWLRCVPWWCEVFPALLVAWITTPVFSGLFYFCVYTQFRAHLLQMKTETLWTYLKQN